MQDISEGPQEQPTVIEYVVDVGKNPSDPLILKEAGLYVDSHQTSMDLCCYYVLVHGMFIGDSSN